MKKCINCGKELGDDYAYCIYCAKKQNNNELVEPKKKSNKLPLIITFSILGVIIISGIVFFGVYFLNKNPNEYAKAENYLVNGQYDEAIKAFSALGDYSDSSERVTDSLYQKALSLYQNESFKDAKTILENLDDYKETKKILNNIKIEENYQYAVRFQEQGDFVDAYEILINLGDYKDTSDRIEEISGFMILGIFSNDDISTWKIDSESTSILGSYIMFNGKYQIEFKGDKTISIYYRDEYFTGTYKVVDETIKCIFEKNSLDISSATIEIIQERNKGTYLNTPFVDNNVKDVYWTNNHLSYIYEYLPEQYSIEEYANANRVLYDFFASNSYDDYLENFFEDGMLDLEFYVTVIDNDYLPDLLIKYKDEYYMFSYDVETKSVVYIDENIEQYIVGNDLSQMVKVSREYQAKQDYLEWIGNYEDDTQTQCLYIIDKENFALDINLYEGVGKIEGTYRFDGKVFEFVVSKRNFKGFVGDDVDVFTFIIENGNLRYLGDTIGMLENDSLFYRCE